MVPFIHTCLFVGSCDATGKVLIVDCATQEIMSEFLGGDVSCSAWNFWSRRQRQDVFLVTAGLDKLVIWDSVSGMIESHQGVPPEGGEASEAKRAVRRRVRSRRS